MLEKDERKKKSCSYEMGSTEHLVNKCYSLRVECRLTSQGETFGLITKQSVGFHWRTFQTIK